MESPVRACGYELQLLSYAGTEPVLPQRLRLNSTPSSIGRSPGCHLSLDDPERLISRSHLAAWVDATGRVRVRNTSSSSPAFVGGAELLPAQELSIEPGAHVQIGRFLLGLQALAEPAASRVPAVASSYIAEAPSIPADFDVFAAPTSTTAEPSVSEVDLGEFREDRAALAQVFDGLPAFDARGPAAEPGGLLAAGAQLTAPPTSPAIDLSDLLTPERSAAERLGLGAEPASPISDTAASSVEIDSLFELPRTAADPGIAMDLMQSGSAQTLPPSAPSSAQVQASSASATSQDALLRLLGEGAQAAVAEGLAEARAPEAPLPPRPEKQAPAARLAQSTAGRVFTTGAQPALSTQTMSMAANPGTQGESAAARAVAASAAPSAGVSTAGANAVAATSGPVKPSPSPSPSPTAASVPSVASAPSTGADSAALAAAFARGCGLGVEQIGAFDEATVEKLGQLFAALVDGALHMVHARSSTKHEMRANVTIIATSGNNPMKFAPDAQAAMVQLLGRGLPGFMPPVEAVADAFEDLRAHQVGLLAASRSAMYAVAQRLAPENIAQSAGGPRGFSGLLPSAHKARLWEHYASTHAALLGEAREEFEAAFQSAFVRAYEGEVSRLQASAQA